MLTTVRKSLTRMETQGYTPASIVLNPTDFEGIELALSTVNAVEHMSLPFDAAARRLWGTPLVVTNAVAAGTAYSLASGGRTQHRQSRRASRMVRDEQRRRLVKEHDSGALRRALRDKRFRAARRRRLRSDAVRDAWRAAVFIRFSCGPPTPQGCA